MQQEIWQDVLWVVGALTAVLVLFETMRRTIGSPLVKWLRVLADFLADVGFEIVQREST